MNKIVQILIFLIILQISLSYPLISKMNLTKVSVHCNLTNSINFNAEIAHILKTLPLNVIELKISCNVKRNISLNQDSFPKNLSLTYLHFDGLVFNILPNSFRNLKRLSFLIFDKCVFRNLQVHPFGELYNLQYLNLSSNSISNFNELLIPYSSNLSRLIISNNNISFFSETIYKLFLQFVNVIDIRNNPLQCHCINKWIYLQKFNSQRLLIDRQSLKNCTFSTLDSVCPELLISDHGTSTFKYVYTFQNVVIDCPINFNTTLKLFKYWIGPNNETFGLTKDVFNDVKFYIQPLFTETIVRVNETSNSVNIINFRGYFRGNWTCLILSASGKIIKHTVTVIAKVHTKEIFDFSITVGFSFASAWLLVAICVGLVQYCKETSCCRHKIDYNTSNLFEKRYVQTVIPVPMVDSVSESSSNDSDINCTKPLNNRQRYDFHNNDVQLIFKDQELANEYAQMLSQLKEASETGDENFKDRLTTLRTRFSIDFNKMRFELKRGMESLKSNSSAAAHKLRKSVGHMKDHMKSFTEFCGTSSMAQSISIVVISSSSSNVNHMNMSNNEEQLHKKQIFRFFEPIG